MGVNGFWEGDLTDRHETRCTHSQRSTPEVIRYKFQAFIRCLDHGGSINTERAVLLQSR
jgi:hypothetical protein